MKKTLLTLSLVLFSFSSWSGKAHGKISTTSSFISDYDCNDYARDAAQAHMVHYYGAGWHSPPIATASIPWNEYREVKEAYQEYCLEYTALGYQVLPPFFMDQ